MHFFDPLYGKVSIPSYCHAIADSRQFRRLQYLRQLGLCHLSFPGGNHTRFEHSIGAFHLATRICVALGRSRFKKSEQERLRRLIQVSALCHDIGHGPFSHMSENVLLGLGLQITHEEIGAALLVGPLAGAFEDLRNFGITPELVGHIITKTPTDDPMAACASTLVSSELDVDRMDYLHRDAHYSGSDFPRNLLTTSIESAWEFEEKGGQFFVELTDIGVNLAEQMLMLRRNNYRRIVFNSDHMCATGMFEKAMLAVFRDNTNLSKELNQIVSVALDWENQDSVNSSLGDILRVYSMVDYEALFAMRNGCSEARYLIAQITRGTVHKSVARYTWGEMHHLTKLKLSAIKNAKDSFMFRRELERNLAEHCGIDAQHVVVHVPELRQPKPMLLGVRGGKTLEDCSDLTRFFQGDYLKQFTVEIFVDPQVERSLEEKLKEIARGIFLEGLTLY
jgi:HD superfamily phosphohydrolase